MKLALFGRIIFGASAILFGVIALMWHDAQTWQNLVRIWRLPSGTTIGATLMIAQILGGILLPWARTVRLGSLVLIVVYVAFSLACVPGIVATPKDYDEWGSFFEQFALLSGAVAAFASSQARASQARTLSRFARVGLGLSAISFTLSQAIFFQVTAEMVPKWIAPSQSFWAAVTTAAFALAAAALLANRQARLAARLMALMVALFGIFVWIPHLTAHPESHLNWSEFALTFLIAGAAWVVSELKSL